MSTHTIANENKRDMIKKFLVWITGHVSIWSIGSQSSEQGPEFIPGKQIQQKILAGSNMAHYHYLGPIMIV